MNNFMPARGGSAFGRKKIFFFVTLVLAVIAGVIIYKNKLHNSQPNLNINKSNFNQTPMKIESPAFADNQSIPSKYTCQGANVNPSLKFSDVPVAAKSLALIVDDPDAPGGTWTHWVVWNVAPSTLEIAEASVPAEAKQGPTSFGSPGYGGPCPPSGQHRYFFKLFALDSMLNLRTDTTADQLVTAMAGHIVSQTQLVGLYAKQ